MKYRSRVFTWKSVDGGQFWRINRFRECVRENNASVFYFDLHFCSFPQPCFILIALKSRVQFMRYFFAEKFSRLPMKGWRIKDKGQWHVVRQSSRTKVVKPRESEMMLLPKEARENQRKTESTQAMSFHTNIIWALSWKIRWMNCQFVQEASSTRNRRWTRVITTNDPHKSMLNCFS